MFWGSWSNWKVHECIFVVFLYPTVQVCEWRPLMDMWPCLFFTLCLRKYLIINLVNIKLFFFLKEALDNDMQQNLDSLSLTFKKNGSSCLWAVWRAHTHTWHHVQILSYSFNNRDSVLTLFCYPWFMLSTLVENKVLKPDLQCFFFFQECLSCNSKSIRNHKYNWELTICCDGHVIVMADGLLVSSIR